MLLKKLYKKHYYCYMTKTESAISNKMPSIVFETTKGKKKEHFVGSIGNNSYKIVPNARHHFAFDRPQQVNSCETKISLYCSLKTKKHHGKNQNKTLFDAHLSFYLFTS